MVANEAAIAVLRFWSVKRKDGIELDMNIKPHGAQKITQPADGEDAPLGG